MQELRKHWPLLLLLVVLVPYLIGISDRGWIPHDEGLLAQSAERVLQGQWPHADFDDPYTGGLAFYHAMLFKLFGINLYSLRLGLLGFSVAGAVAIYFILGRLTAPWLSALLTALAMAWSTPNYFAGLPSWYNLFLALFCTVALMRFFDTSRGKWLFVAGLFCGLSFLVKSTGIFSACAAILAIVFHEQETAERGRGGELKGKINWILFAILVCFALLGFSTAILLFIQNRPTPMDFFHFVMPVAAGCLFLMWNEWRLGPSEGLNRFRRLLAWESIFISGVVLPVGAFLIPYIYSNQLVSFIEGVFVLPQKRISWSSYPLPEWKSVLWSLPVAIWIFIPGMVRKRWDPWWLAIPVFALSLGLIVFGSWDGVYARIWDSTRPLVPLSVLAGCLLLARRSSLDESLSKRSLLFSLLISCALLSLLQFPYAFAIYFCYVAPMFITACCALSLLSKGSPRWILLGCAVMYFGFAVVWLHRGHIRRIGVQFVPYDNVASLSIPRFGLKTTQAQADLYQQVIEEIQKHSRDGDTIYATADCPEIYFLAARRNPTRSFYDFFEYDFDGPPQARVRRILKLLDEANVEVVVIHWTPEFSGTPSDLLVDTLAERFPQVRHFYRGQVDPNQSAPTFSVAWRTPAEANPGQRE